MSQMDSPNFTALSDVLDKQAEKLRSALRTVERAQQVLTARYIDGTAARQPGVLRVESMLNSDSIEEITKFVEGLLNEAKA